MTGYGGSNDHFGCDNEMSYELVGALSNNCDSSTGGRTFRIKLLYFEQGKQQMATKKIHLVYNIIYPTTHQIKKKINLRRHYYCRYGKR